MKKALPLAAMTPIYGFDLPNKSGPEPEQPFPSPSDVRRFDGFGADQQDISRGYLEPNITNNPKYDNSNYKDRYSEPKVSDSDEQGTPTRDDFEFRMKERESRGFLTRPRIPTDR